MTYIYTGDLHRSIRIVQEGGGGGRTVCTANYPVGPHYPVSDQCRSTVYNAGPTMIRIWILPYVLVMGEDDLLFIFLLLIDSN